MKVTKETDKEKKEFAEAMQAMETYRRNRALKALFEKSSFDLELNDLNFFMKLFCWVKTLICLLLNRTNGSYLDDDKFCILSYDEYSFIEGIGWDACWVSPYFFKDWNVCLASDGN